MRTLLKFGGVKIADMRSGKVNAPQCNCAPAIFCPLCKAEAVLPLDAATRALQPDDTLYVCHPLLGGCNHGFAAAGYTFHVVE